MVKISVIVPCYNAESYVRGCMDSILYQTLHEIEIILVDDGSTDRTLEILEEYQKRYNNIKILRQENQGPGIARNQGIMVAIGEYIAFMDVDDLYPSQNTLENVYTTAKAREALICGGSTYNYCNGVLTYKDVQKGFVFSEDGWISKNDFPTASGFWRFIYKSEFLRNNQVFFPKYLQCEDPPFLLEAVARAGQVYCMKEATYVYRKGHKHVFYTQEKAIDLAKGIRDSLMISKREGMVEAYLQRLSMLHGVPSARMYYYAGKCAEIELIIHQINEIIGDSSDSENGIPLLKEGEEISNYLKDVQEEKNRLLEGLKQEKKVLIFGAGFMGKNVYEFLDENGVIMEAFVVSDVTKNAVSVGGLQVRCIDDYMDVRNDCMVVIATYPVQQEKIKEILRIKGFKKVYPFSLEKFYLFEAQAIE